MKQDIKERWVAALRSGDYKQTQEKLRDASGFCCLGVLCDVVKDEMGVKWSKWEKYPGGFSFMDSNGELPSEVARFCGLPVDKTSRMDITVNGHSLIGMNDFDGEGFDTIADMIEKYL